MYLKCISNVSTVYVQEGFHSSANDKSEFDALKVKYPQRQQCICSIIVWIRKRQPKRRPLRWYTLSGNDKSITNITPDKYKFETQKCVLRKHRVTVWVECADTATKYLIHERKTTNLCVSPILWLWTKNRKTAIYASAASKASNYSLCMGPIIRQKE